MTIFFMILMAYGLIMLLIYLFCRYAKIFRTLPDGKRILIGYVWKWSNSYIIYDGIPFFFAERIGFLDKNKNVFLKTVNNQYNFVELQYGQVDDSGNVTDTNNNRVAVCDSIGQTSRSTLVNDLSGNEIAYAKTGFRKGDDLLVRAAAAGASCALKSDDETALKADVRIGFKDLALPSALIFMLIFVPVAWLGYDTTIMTFLGTVIAYVSYMMLAYALICWILYFIKKCLTMRNMSMVHILGLIDRNVGVNTWNIVIIILSAGLAISSIIFTNYTMLPLFLVLFVGFTVNLGCFNGDWKVADPCSTWGSKWGRTTQTKPVITAPAPGRVEKVYSWAAILEAKGIQNHNNEEVVLSFTESEYDLNGRVRASNPFFNDTPATLDELKQFAIEVLKGSNGPNNEESQAIVTIINSAYQLCQKYNLADFELYDLILHFCQENIVYALDEDCPEINNIKEYFRFPAETLFDGKGDCDCKSVLGYMIFKSLGVNADLAFVKANNSADYNHVALVLQQDSTSVVPVPKTYPQYTRGKVYCEFTGSNFTPGDVPTDVDVNSIMLVG